MCGSHMWGASRTTVSRTTVSRTTVSRTTVSRTSPQHMDIVSSTTPPLQFPIFEQMTAILLF